MNLSENIKEGIKSINANLLRTVLTALIVTLGITALVGALAAVDAIEFSVKDGLADLGVDTFDIYSKRNRGGNRGGVKEKPQPPMTLKQAQRFIDNYRVPANISLSTFVTQIAEVKRLSKKTNPNVWVQGANDEFIALEGLDLQDGRNFSLIENQNGTNVAIIGPDVVEALFEDNEDPLKSDISFLGAKYKVIGILEEQGQIGGNNRDNSILIPILNASKMSTRRILRYNLSVGISNATEIDMAMGEATALMRKIRQDRLGDPNSFEIAKSETLADTMADIAGGLRWGGGIIGFVTLLGAAIALMNIMLVSVTERTREVGVRKALGATPLRIRQQFIIEAIVVCMMGGVLGVILGVVIGAVVTSAIGSATYVVPWIWMLTGFVICIFVGILSGYWPAYKASKLDPIESLRFE